MSQGEILLSMLFFPASVTDKLGWCRLIWEAMINVLPCHSACHILPHCACFVILFCFNMPLWHDHTTSSFLFFSFLGDSANHCVSDQNTANLHLGRVWLSRGSGLPTNQVVRSLTPSSPWARYWTTNCSRWLCHWCVNVCVWIPDEQVGSL